MLRWRSRHRHHHRAHLSARSPIGPTRGTLAAALAALGLAACGWLDDDDGAALADEPVASTTAPADPEPGLTPNATVMFVVDGDTIEVDIDGVQETIRFIGIDTPEKTGGFRDPECFGDEASARMSELLGPGDGVYLELDEEARDRFDRLLAYVYRASDATFLNELMIEEGLAEAFPFEPNTLYADRFDRLEARARELNIGLWRACGSADVPLQPSG